MKEYNKYTDILIKESKKSLKYNDIPVSAIILKNDKLISIAHNTKYKNKQSIEHAEINAIKLACKKLKTNRLDDCILISTLEPCNMCYGAIVESHIKKVYYLLNSNYIKSTTNFESKISKQLLTENSEYKMIIEDFFKKKRNKL